MSATLEELRTIITRLGTTHLVTMGNSIGGFGAVRYASRLGAAATLSFSGPTTLDSTVAPDLAAAAAQHADPGVNTLLMQDTPDNDLVADVAASPSMHVTYCYGAESQTEFAHGSRISAYFNVTLHPITGCDDHFVPLHVIAQGGFTRLLAEALKLELA